MNKQNVPTENGAAGFPLETIVMPNVVPGKKLFSFASFDKWVNGAQGIWQMHGVRGADTVCVDQKGRICGWGKHFMTARDEKAFPVDVYLLREDMET